MSSRRKSHRIQTEDIDSIQDTSQTPPPPRTRRNSGKTGSNQNAPIDDREQSDRTFHEDHHSSSSHVHRSQRSNKRRRTESDHSPPSSHRTNGKAKGHAERSDTIDFSEQEEHQVNEAEENGDEDEHDDEDEASTIPSGPNEQISSKTLTRDTDGFLPGSIVRVVLRNFVTYGHVEFFPGPYLNMIIGPNGTGKSTLVCAIALGLGFPTSVLDRAGEVKLFIKNGCDDGSIEIELKGHPGKKNVIVKLHLIMANNTRIFELNGKKTTLSHVQETVKSFNIQANNLCCFLPQEKVSKFAEMKESELLKETQKAAGHPKLNHWHEILIKDGKSKIELEAKLSSTQKSFKDLEKQVESLQREVDRLKERQVIENKIRSFEIALDQNKYMQEKLQYETAKATLNEAKKIIAQMEVDNGPLNDQKKYFKLLSEQLQSCHKKIHSASTRCKTSLARLDPSLKAAAAKLESASEKLSALKDDERRQKELRLKLAMEVERLAEKIKEPIEEPDSAPFQEELRSLSVRIRQIQGDIENLQSLQKDTYEERRKLVEQQNEFNREIQSLQSVSGRKEADLKESYPRIHQALQIMRKFKVEGRFRGKVFEPIRLEIAPKEPRFARAIEGCLSRDVLNSFLFTDPHDYDLMAHECNDNAKLRVNLACMRPGDSLSNYPFPLPQNALKDLGFDDYVLDLVNGPDEVLTHLCSQGRLHRVPIAHDSRAQVDEVRLKDRSFPIKQWILGSTRYTISFSAYGSNEIIIKSFEISVPRILSTADVDTSIISKKKDGLETLRGVAAEKEEMVAQLRAKETGLRQEDDQLKKRKKEVEASWKEAKEPHVEYLKNVANHKSKTQALHIENSKPSLDQERNKRKVALLEASKAYAAVIIKSKKLLIRISHLNTSLITLNLRIHQHSTDRNGFEELYKQKNSDLENRKTILQQDEMALKELFKRAKATAAELFKTNESATREVIDEVKSISLEIGEIREKYKEEGMEDHIILEKIREKLTKLWDDEKMNLESALPIDPSIMNRYHRLTSKMEEEKKTLHNLEENSRRQQDQIQKVYDRWRPRLDELVSNVDEKFDAAFKRMGCLGHVAIKEDADYDKWGIEIKVSFRDNEPLVRLDTHRQSGGERSLSTIMYLMSLTELGKSPFSLVDEINQGMDRRAERLVHDQLVETTCKQSASQYFLITPKLLFGLRYHPLMRVLCVNNGDWLPADYKFGPWLDKAKAKKRHATIARQ